MSNKDYTFEAPVRRPLVLAYNQVGSALRSLGWKGRLHADDILRLASQRTGLSDLGYPQFPDLLHRLTQAYEDEADLTPFGRLFIRLSLLSITKTRLRMQDYLRQHPRIREARPLDPLIVVGMPRSGTTLLYNLLCQDPEGRPLLCWESSQPAPVSGRLLKRDSRERDTRLAVAIINRLAPGLRHVHAVDPVGPEECTWLMANTLVSPIFGLFGRIPSYFHWLWGLDAATWGGVYQDYLTQLRILQHQRGGGHWVLKSPVHMMSLPHLLAAIPEARVVLTDRDPAAVVPSACSLFAVVRALGCDHIDREALGAEILDLMARFQRTALEAARAYPERVARVHYRDFTQDKVGTVKAIYSHFGMPFSADNEQQLSRWLKESKHVASHGYDLGQFGLTERQIRDAFPTPQ